MANDLRLVPAAVAEVQQAFAWYQERKPGLGFEFLDSIEESLRSIRQSPLSNAIVRRNCRRALLRKFPFAVFYEIEEEAVTVYCVFHTSRDPRKCQRRLG